METNTCPTCQSPIPEHAPGGFCPACLLRDAVEPTATGHAAPSLEEIASAFPQMEVIELIGQGGMGFVYKVRQPGLDRVVALKILSPELSRDPAFAERFAREARTLGKLHHPNIVTVFEHGVSQPSTLNSQPFFYLLMEFVDGVNLRQAMRAGRFTPEQALAIVPGICDALQAAHAEGIWHRDIKPENILLDREGRVKIADFGIARIVGDPQRDFTLTRTGNALGSVSYMAPEQHEKPHEVDHRADIYSLGVVIYEMLTGELPLGRFPAPSQRAAVDSRIDEIVFKTLEKERDLRQQSAAEVKTDVHRAVQPGVIQEGKSLNAPASHGPGLGRLALGLFLFGIAIPFLLGIISERAAGIGFILSAILMLLTRVLGGFSWREKLGKVTTIASTLVLLLYALFILFMPRSPSVRHEKASTKITPRAAVSEFADTIADPAAGSEASLSKGSMPIASPEEVFRKANAAANESNGEAFEKYMGAFYISSDPVANSGQSGARVPSRSTLENMKYFLGEIVILRVVSVEQQRLLFDEPDPPLKGFAPVAYATTRRGDGAFNRLAVSFVNHDGQWQGAQAWNPNWRASIRIEFKPEMGDAVAILKTHLGSNSTFRAVEGTPGIFDVFSFHGNAERAKEYTDDIVNELRESLEKFDLGKYVKVVTPAKMPELPYMGENELPFPP